MFTEKITAYLKSVSATGQLHARGMPFVPKKLLKLSPFNRELYNSFLTEAAHWDLGPKPLILDVGANNGDFALAFQTVYPDAALHLFEPLVRHLDRLKHMKDTGGFPWTIHPYALGSRSEELTIEVPAGFEDASSLLGFSKEYLLRNPQSSQTESQPCQVRPLDELLDATQNSPVIDLLKIDVEGFEFAVLEGAALTLPRVRNVVVEVSLLRHSEESDCPIARMVTTMDRAGLSLFRMQPTLFDTNREGKPLEYDLYFRNAKTNDL